jgi:hypothetical protein
MIIVIILICIAAYVAILASLYAILKRICDEEAAAVLSVLWPVVLISSPFLGIAQLSYKFTNYIIRKFKL